MADKTMCRISKLISLLIQLYNGAKDNTGSETELQAALYKIENELQAETAAIRKAIKELHHLEAKLQATNDDAWEKLIDKQKEHISNLKKKLPAVTWSGTFTKRSIKGIKEYSQLICLDFDKLNTLQHTEYVRIFKEDPYTHILFTSPSGNGIKVIFKVNGNADQHKDFFLSIEKYFSENYHLQIDQSGKDVSRLCFLCHDAELYINDNCKTYDEIFKPVEVVKAVKAFTPAERKEFETTDDFYSIIEFTNKRLTYAEGSRNQYIYLFANNCNRKGFDEPYTIGFCRGYFEGLPMDEIEATVKSAFTHNTHEHAKFAKKSKAAPAGNASANKNVPAKKLRNNTDASGVANHAGTKGTDRVQGSADLPQSENGSSEKPITFWKERKITKGKDDNKFTTIVYELKRVEFVEFLFQQGFHLIDTDSKGYQICYSHHGIIEPVDSRIIKKHVFAWCKKNAVRDIEEMLRKGQKQFFASNEMDALNTKHIQFKTDTETESYFYFKNCWVTVNADGVTQNKYSDLTQYIWAGNKKEHEFTIQPPTLLTDTATPVLSPAAMDSEFAKFIYYCAYNPKNIDEKDFDAATIEQRFESFCTAIGYLLDGYKHPANRTAVFALDHKIGERDEQHGGTGKSIIPKACQQLKVVSHINGKSYDPKYQFRNEPITADAQVIDFNDMQRNFDMENIFEIIADDYSINRRNNGFLHFKYENSPKVYYSTNAIPKGAGSSYVRRMKIIEFSDYFTPEHTPFDEFGHGLLGSAWDVNEWNRFYNFMLFCVQSYKASGLIAYPKSNFDARKMANEVNIEFIDFMDGKIEKDRKMEHATNHTLLNKRIKKTDLLEEFNKEYLNLYGSKLKPHTFYKWVKQYCNHKGLFFNPHIPAGKYDKSNGIEYYTIATSADFKPNVNDQQADLFKT